MRRGLILACWLLVAHVAGCEGEQLELHVDLRTDLRPGTEFDAVEVSLEREGRAAVLRLDVDGDDAFGNGRRVADFADLAPGTYDLRVLLEGEDGTAVLSRPVRVSLLANLVATVVMTRDCRDVSCPNGDPSLTACLGGRCVDPRCTAGEGAFCGEPSCVADGDCPDPSPCASGRCLDGVCLVQTEDALCGATAWCHPEAGCTPKSGAADGDLVVPAGAIERLNAHTVLVEDAAAGGTSVIVEDGGAFALGDRVLLWHTTGLGETPSGAPEPVRLEGADPGLWEAHRLARVESAGGADRLELEGPLGRVYPAGVTQVLRVPEYDQARIEDGAMVEALPWDGRVGGIVAFEVRGELELLGAVSATASGFRGGAALSASETDHSRCFELDEAFPRGAPKGEGLVSSRFGDGHTGRGNVANGGGGGNCHNAGGAGGGHGGAGGLGGRDYGDLEGGDDTGGLGGAPVVYVPDQRLVMGGGGGAGEVHHGEGLPGGAGGGVIWIRTGSVSGPGTLEASGGSVGFQSDDGGAGGGAGGAVWLDSAGVVRCGGILVEGGTGGDTEMGPSGYYGPGGGGAGGIVRLQGTMVDCPVSAAGGSSGLVRGEDHPHGATDGGDGVVDVN